MWLLRRSDRQSGVRGHRTMQVATGLQCLRKSSSLEITTWELQGPLKPRTWVAAAEVYPAFTAHWALLQALPQAALRSLPTTDPEVHPPVPSAHRSGNGLFPPHESRRRSQMTSECVILNSGRGFPPGREVVSTEGTPGSLP